MSLTCPQAAGPRQRLDTSPVFVETSEPGQRPETSHVFPKTSEPRQGSEVFFSNIPGSRLLPFVLFALVAGCSSDESISNSAPYYAGTFEASCSPVDAPAIVFDLFRLGDPDPPQVSIAIWQFESLIAGTPIELKARSGYGAAFIGGTEWIPASDGAIELQEYQQIEVARGRFWLELDGVGRVEGQFEATWTDAGPAICG